MAYLVMIFATVIILIIINIRTDIRAKRERTENTKKTKKKSVNLINETAFR